MGLFDSIIQPVAGLIGLGGAVDGSDVPNPGIAQYTPEQQARLDKYVKESDRSAADINSDWMRGVQQAGEMPRATPLEANQANAGVNAAINSKYNTLTQENIGRLKQQYDYQSQLEENNRKQQGFAMLSAKQKMDIANQERLMKARMAREHARASAIGSIFGAVGMAGGAYLGAMGGGGWGAMAGAQAGSKLGEGIGGTL